MILCQLSAASLSTLTAGSGADTIKFVKAISSGAYSNQGNDLVSADGGVTSSTFAGGKGTDSIVVGGKCHWRSNPRQLWFRQHHYCWKNQLFLGSWWSW